MNGEASVPSFAEQPGPRGRDYGTDEYAGLYISYGLVPTPFPYRMQENYSRELYDNEEDVIILENEYLRATFFPHYGGKLASLFDKEKGKELLFSNPVIRPCNLAIRNAWMSGGVEWNCGIFGHHVHTCDTLFCAKTELDDGTPVLRFYEFERIRRAVVQMDFFLPEGSRFLYARMRITNPNPEVIPMYWWSNIAVPEDPNGRVITWANGSYINGGNVSEIPIPINDGKDVSYPVNTDIAMDYFYNIPANKRKFECQLGKDGYGFVQTSTSRLQGRKLFIWGQSAGGERWQNYMTANDCDGLYVELQAGLAHTQYESLPMPPESTWEWLEAYGALQADPEKVHGEWHTAQAEADRALNELLTEDALEAKLLATRDMATRRAEDVLFEGSGWGALEIKLRESMGVEKKMTPHLDFGECGPEQAQWLSLLEESFFPEPDVLERPASYMLQPEWTQMLEKACETVDRFNWYAHLQLSMIYFAMRRIDDAEREAAASLNLKISPWGLYTMAHVELEKDNKNEGALLCMRASKMLPRDLSIAKEAMTLLVCLRMYDQALALLKTFPEEIQENGRIRVYALMANVRLGNIEESEKILYGNGGLVIPDVREGETLVTEMWWELEELKAKRDGREFSRQTAEVPAMFDFRTAGPRRKSKKK